MELQTLKIYCPKCKQDITAEFEKFLANITGMKRIDFKNGGLEIVKTAFFVGKEMMQVKAVEASNENAARKIIEESLKKLKELMSPEIERKKIEEMKKELEEKYRHLTEENKELAKELREKDKLYLQNQEQVLKILNQIAYQPLLTGKTQEKQIAVRLATISNSDKFDTLNSNKQGEDVLATIIQDKKEIGRVVIESKKVRKWSNDFITQVKKYMQREGANFGILATTALPSDALNPKMYKITEDGIWIVKIEYLEVCYRAIRDFLLKLKKMEEASNKKITDFEKLLKSFRSMIESREYQEKFTLIKTCVDSLREVASKLLVNAQTTHKHLQEIAQKILNSIETIESENNKVLQEFFR
jgi:hypothetical protein